MRSPGDRDGVTQQRGLADPRFAAQHEGRAAAGARAVQQRLDPTALRVPATQRLGRDAHHHPRSLREPPGDPSGRLEICVGSVARA
jgi:hypothetical protein